MRIAYQHVPDDFKVLTLHSPGLTKQRIYEYLMEQFIACIL